MYSSPPDTSSPPSAPCVTLSSVCTCVLSSPRCTCVLTPRLTCAASHPRCTCGYLSSAAPCTLSPAAPVYLSPPSAPVYDSPPSALGLSPLTTSLPPSATLYSLHLSAHVVRPLPDCTCVHCLPRLHTVYSFRPAATCCTLSSVLHL
uniref:Uncharacterized protein n=1 Tax=Knipowitschia caucasica TaxID=637954 RepID=A0AAV2JME7_KNICA